MTDAAIKDQIERAKKVDIMSVLDVKLLGKSGTRFRGECPICGSSKGQKGTGAFSVDPVGNRYHCFGNCNGGGDVIKLAQAVWRCSFREAVEDLLNEELAKTRRSVAPAAVQQAAPETGPTSAERMATDFWRDGSPGLIGTLAEVYLRHRGLCDEIIALMDKRFRFHPAAKETWDKDQRRWSTWPAMIGRVATAGGFTGGVHVTYLARDGRGKARIPAAKRMWGPQSDKEGRPGGIWLTQPSAPGPLIVGEGIESTASAGQLTGLPCRMVATLSLNRLQGGCKLDKWGRMDLGTVQADPERPPFTWPEPKAAPWGEVLIAVDRDMNPVKVNIRKHGGGTIEHVLDAEARARICAGLAVQAWKAAGANRVRAIAPAAGRDFNTELQECVV